MKSKDIKELSRLFKMKQQAAALKLNKCIAEQGRLHDAARQCLQDSFALNLDGVDQSSAADLAVASRRQTYLRTESDRLSGMAKNLDGTIDLLREKTRHALNRDIVTKTLLAEDTRNNRIKINHKDEEAREQLTIKRRKTVSGA